MQVGIWFFVTDWETLTLLHIFTFVLVVCVAIWAGVKLLLRAPTYTQYDLPPGRLMRSKPSDTTVELHRSIREMTAEVRKSAYKDQIALGRELLDAGMLGASVAAADLDVRTREVNAGGVPAEWVLGPESDPRQRLLYIHGGGFFIGSPASARAITAAFAHKAGVAVLSVDYRLMPENHRLDSVEDCQRAYEYILANGPDGADDAGRVYLSGDSAGGNLALAVAAWARDTGKRSADAMVVFAPTTDSNFEAPSISKNVSTDPVLGSSLGVYTKLPVTIRALLALVMSRVNPRNKVVSPLYGDLGDLPPTLVQVSNSEMLRDDSRRYVNKAAEAGAPVTLQEWPGTVHVFQMFGHIVPEAEEALENAARFLTDPDTMLEKEKNRRNQHGAI